ncbi:hypothetical protein [Streptomyces gobiensis]|uniref:hypothetical protein n=1 Tax=Streptomyces gobiensis TaxID=2875706 RepID=UPI001E439546|nr:hypothetical protein [Streptomyces gobiensis]UGY93066.1 hypothetical protein test1122_16005 [Streptomyces gobiensis]
MSSHTPRCVSPRVSPRRSPVAPAWPAAMSDPVAPATPMAAALAKNCARLIPLLCTVPPRVSVQWPPRNVL